MRTIIFFTIIWPWLVVAAVITLHYTNIVDALSVPIWVVIPTMAIPPIIVVLQNIYEKPEPMTNEQNDKRSIARNDATLTDDDKQKNQ